MKQKEVNSLSKVRPWRPWWWTPRAVEFMCSGTALPVPHQCTADFFAEFLATTGVYDACLSSCPLTYSSLNAPDKRDVLGTWLLAILAGHKRYAHRY